jgi:hypothetical protein
MAQADRCLQQTDRKRDVEFIARPRRLVGPAPSTNPKKKPQGRSGGTCRRAGEENTVPRHASRSPGAELVPIVRQPKIRAAKDDD